ncbi:MAG: CheF family chemotaxis protein, partial [Halobacteriota archaeon]
TMAEAIVADFVGRFHTVDVGGSKPVTGRVLLSKKRLVLAYDGGKTTIPIAAVSDINVGTVPGKFTEFFKDTISLAYDVDGSRHVAVIESAGENVGRFKTVLFKTLLAGLTVKVKQPAKVGGRVTDASVQTATLKLSSGALRIEGDSIGVTIDLSSVTDFARGMRQMGDSRYPTLAVTHVVDGTATTTLVTLPNERKLTLLGRYLQLEYKDAMAEVADLNIPPEGTEILVSLYTTDGEAPLRDLVTGDVASVQLVLEDLREKGLVVDADSGVALTPKGRVLVTEQLEDVNQ